MDNNEIPPLLVSVATGKRIIGVGHTKIYELIGSGEIKSVKIGSKRLLDYKSLEALAQNLGA